MEREREVGQKLGLSLPRRMVTALNTDGFGRVSLQSMLASFISMRGISPGDV